MTTFRQIIGSCVAALLLTVTLTQNLFASKAVKLCRNNLVVINTQTNQLEKNIPLPFEGWSVGTYPDSKMLAVYPVYKYKYNIGTDSENALLNTQDLSFSTNDKLLQAIYDTTNAYVKNYNPDPDSIEKFASIGVDKGDIVVMNSSQPNYVIDHRHHKLYMIEQGLINVLDSNDPSKEVKQIHLGFSALQMAMSPDDDVIYVIGDHYLAVIDTDFHDFLISSPFKRLRLHFIAVRPDGKQVYITASTEDTKNNRTIGHLLILDDKGVNIKDNALYNWRPQEVAFTPDSKKAIITNFDSSYFYILPTELDDSSSWAWGEFSGTNNFRNPEKIMVPSWLSFGGTPISLANPVVSPEGMVYFSLYDSGNVVTYDLKNGMFSKIDTTSVCNCSGYFACNLQPVVLSK